MATIRKVPESPWAAMIGSAFYANSVRKASMAEICYPATKQPEAFMASDTCTSRNISAFRPERKSWFQTAMVAGHRGIEKIGGKPPISDLRSFRFRKIGDCQQPRS